MSKKKSNKNNRKSSSNAPEKSGFAGFVDRYYFAVAGLVFAISVAITFLVVFRIANVRENKEKKEQEIANMGELSPDGRDYALEINAHPEVNEVMEEYHKALADYDEETIRKYLLYVNQNELDSIEVKSDYIDSYDNITCYTQKAEAEGAYYVYVSYDLKMKGYATKLPMRKAIRKSAVRVIFPKTSSQIFILHFPSRMYRIYLIKPLLHIMKPLIPMRI